MQHNSIADADYILLVVDLLWCMTMYFTHIVCNILTVCIITRKWSKIWDYYDFTKERKDIMLVGCAIKLAKSRHDFSIYYLFGDEALRNWNHMWQVKYCEHLK